MTSACPPKDTALATAPPARHTKSALWAPMTCTRLGTDADPRQPPRVVHGHDPDLLLAEPRLQEPVGHERQAVLDGRVEDLPEIAAPHGALGADRARRREDRLPRALARVGRGERALEQRAAL